MHVLNLCVAWNLKQTPKIVIPRTALFAMRGICSCSYRLLSIFRVANPTSQSQT